MAGRDSFPEMFDYEFTQSAEECKDPREIGATCVVAKGVTDEDTSPPSGTVCQRNGSRRSSKPLIFKFPTIILSPSTTAPAIVSKLQRRFWPNDAKHVRHPL